MLRRSVTLGFAIAAALCAQPDRQFTDVPDVPTPPNVVDAMLDLADIKPADVLIDLGSGDGRIVIAACKRFGIRATGVEIDPSLVRQSETLPARRASPRLPRSSRPTCSDTTCVRRLS